ncbi:autotransporter outer membrane beta-barrel domain-containing protein [Caulobacter sp. Root487D2Y]|uniref:autotransporter outer membrane beta-barrel domain-containing protein n=1 Tax=Caulobacter sp. Root487D2Y TaxID=1736547 RepID=UPI000AC5FD18|nr:autotransporter outer membrane beta-barrel domain-containing protein [Caulobacter sp. Root487D2Y]
MGKLSAGAAKAAVAESTRVDRLARFAEGLEQLAGRWEREARDPRVAAALSERFGASAPELLATQDAVAHLLASSFGAPGALPPKLLLRLHDALAVLAVLAAYAPPPAELNIVPIVDVKSRAQAVRIETAARKLLKGLGRVLAVGAVGATVLGALPAAAGDYTANANGGGASNGTSLPAHGTNGDGGNDGGSISPSINGSFDKAGGPAVSVTANGSNGGNGGDGFLVPPLVLVGFGGDGGVGGDGGAVDLTVGGDVSTTGDNAVGVQVKSNAGAGGDGGDGYGAYGEGGSGRHGGAGGSANLTNNASVTTGGNQSSALFVQSTGGAGGDGGYGAGIVGSGGAGSGSGPGGSVGVINNGLLETWGTGSNGILAQSVGGLSGSGGSAGGIGAFAGGSNAAGVGGAVNVANHDGIITHGAVSYGILAQSVGGGGGAAGGAGGIAALGGAGSGGGNGGQVDVFNDGVIETGGVASIGMFAQSVGGSGGVGGGAGGLVGIGGGGGSSGDGGAVTATNAGQIFTHNDLATGVFAQSIGGGGGNGAGGGGLVGIGGDGGASGKGGTVTVSNTGTVETDGKLAAGVFAQSVGGGGGNGAGAGGLVAIGGKGGAGGDGDTVTVVNDGALTTHGYDSYAVFAQSVGGGGGNGGGAGGMFAIGGGGSGGGIGGTVNVTNHGAIVTDLDGSGGVFAQSVGGGGGNGGDSTSVGLFVNLSIGGSGGTASRGGDVTVINDGSIATGGDRATAIYAQSVGGGGGDGGFGAGGAIGVYGAVSIGVGGDGGAGGAGGVVHVTADGTLVTTGADSRGVFAQSVGGGGGDGGYTVAAALAVGDVGAAAGSISVGGSGAGGGAGGEVTVDHTTGVNIDTSGDRAVGVFAQSVGGGGGNGGWSGAIALAASGGASASIGVAVGGGADDGGKGGKVTVDTAGQIHTRGVDASAIYAQSIGGGGGTGGFALAGALAGGSAAGAASVGVGGSGGAGGEGDEVKVLSVTDIVTEGDRSAGIFAQAVGGGGGSGGWSGAVAGAGGVAGGSVGVSVGGSGDHGGKGGVVTVNSVGQIDTLGEDATGIFGQSVGGGGGSGGFSLAAAVAGGEGALAGSVGVGGSGAGGGDGDTVDIITHGDIHTRGDRAAGVFAQSIGGGGGNGGWSGSLAGAGGVGAGAVGVSVGGSADGGGVGKDVSILSRGAVATEGDDAAGLMAQSVGGGGGTGGFSLAAGIAGGEFAGSASVGVGGSGGGGGKAGKVLVDTQGDISTIGDRSSAIYAQSVGGGGGSGGWTGALGIAGGTGAGTVAVGVGGSGDVGGAGDTVGVTSVGDLETQGADSHGILAQSIGGGGGSGGFSLAAGVAGGETAGAGSVSVGGSGLGGGDAEAVTVSTAGDIHTHGDRSAGVYAQSVGGGGGDGGWSGSLAIGAGQTAGAVGVSVGGSAGLGGAGRAVTVDSVGTVITEGHDAAGLLAQSIGGGGGTGGFSLAAGVGAGQTAGAASVSVGGTGGAGGIAGRVEVSSEGTIVTGGDRSYGVQAQSIGGGGGSGGWSGSLAVGAGNNAAAVTVGIGGGGGVGNDGGEVEVDVIDLILTLGDDATAVLAQSIGGGGGSGGFSLAAGVGAGQTAGSGSLTVGGFGGSAGDGKIVEVTSHADIGTIGDRANGIQAQSIGGGGGAGGWTAALAVGAGQTSGAVAVGIGGFGAGGGDAGAVTVDSFGQIYTIGDDAAGVLAQSIGGGGGSGGFSLAAGVSVGQSTGAGTLTIGGGGGVGGDAGDVTVHSHDVIITEGDRAYAIQAQSIGGGGGNGGFSASVTAALSSGAPKAISASVGGFGGAGGDGKVVTVTSDLGASTYGEDAHALYAQSVGGGGGSGGFSLAGALTAGTSTVGLSAAIGGAGGAAGEGGDVHVVTDGVTTTDGARSYGVFAQSVGGGGGDGGFAGALTGGLGSTDNIAIGVSIGGFGGAAGKAGDVEVTNHGKVGTLGDGSTAVFAQSVGGGGGSGGMAVSAALGGAKSKNISIALGGSGAGGGKGGDVKVTSTDLVVTEGDDAIAIFAQSVGGGGGAGGAAGALAVSGGESTNLAMNIGGFGGAGSQGGDVTVVNSGQVFTSGEQSHGIFAESVGGGGGHGGMAGIDENQWSDYMAGGAGTVSLGSNSNNISVALGGQGGTGDDGGVVKVTNSGVVATTGESQANAIYAQSIGGGGGDAGVATAASGSFGQGKNGTYAVALGGFGGEAGNGGLVQVVNSGSLSTIGGNSTGIVAQSVGGGGGSGGDARGFSLGFAKKAAGTTKATSVNVSIGGQGGAAGDGGQVDVTNSGQILTEGGDSHGVFAQSVGGGGGRGGLISTQGEEVVTFLDLANKGEAKGGQIAIGGSGAGGGDGGAVTVGNSGLIWTKGKDAHGVFAQSVGGGGGDGGSGLAGEVSIGGQGGVAGDGGAVKVSNSGTIVTEGALSRGVFAQSVGGGGGTGGATDYDGPDTYSYSDALSKTMGEVGKLTDAKDLVDSFSEPAWGISIGGTGGSAGDGGSVTVDNSGAIYTSGRLSHGVMAQSVGGGGGTGGEATITGLGQIVFSGVGGTAGDGGDVIVTNSGLIQTEGFGAYGIFAQSIGGGGGVAGDVSLGIASWGDFSAYGGEDYSDYADMSINPLDGYGGDGGDVTVTNTGDIVLLGAGSVGIFAQSVGGGGGLFGSGLGLSFAGSLGGTGDAGTVTVIQNGNIWAGGLNGIGAFFQSQAGDVPAAGSHSLAASAAAAPTYSAADIVATLNGDVHGGSVYGKGVFVDGGKNNVITLNGVVSAASNLAILATTGNDTIISNKGVIGNIDLGRGVNAFRNTAASTLLTLDYVKLNGGLLTNDGLLTPGGAGLVQVTSVEGDFKQTATGVFLADLDLGKTGKAGEIDRLDITGSLDLKGKFVLQIADPGHILPGDHTAAILNGSGVVTASGLQLVAPVSSIAMFELKTTADDLNLHYVVDFSPAGFNVNRTAVGDHINNIQLAGSTNAFAPVAAELFWEPSQVNLANYYDSFSAETYADQVAVTNFAIAGFTDSMMTCPTAPGQGEADSCVWAKAGGRQLTLDATAQDMAYKERSTGLSGGFENAAGPHWRFGAAASAESLRTGIPTRTQGDGDRYQFGAVAKAADGPLTAAMAFTAGSSSVDTRRAVLLPSGLRMAEAKQRQTFQAITARTGYRFGTDKAYAKPIAELNWARISTDAFAEKGAGALNLVAPKQVDQSTRASVKLEVGGEFMQGVTAIRPYARIGASHMLSGRAPQFTTAFESAAPVAGSFDVAGRLDKTTVDAELGAALVNAKGASARVNWSGQFGDRVSNQALAVKFTVPF